MKLGTCVILGAGGLGSLLLATTLSVEGCSSSTAAGGDGGAPAAVGVPPAAPTSGTTPASTTAHNFALQKLHLGDETPTQPGITAGWMQYGYNLDGLITTATSTNVCTLNSAASTANQVDGPNGLDNSFGLNILPLLEAVDPGPSGVLDTSILAGKFTLMLDVVGLTTVPTQTSTGLTGQLFGGVHFNQAPNSATAVPTFTTSDNWPLDPSYLTTAEQATPVGTPLTQPVTSNVVFNGAYVTNGEFVNGAKTTVTLSLTVSGAPLTLTVNSAIVTFNHTATGTASGGIIAGVLKTTDLVTGIVGVAGELSSSLCSGTTLMTIEQKIEEASDILSDGTNTPGVPCDGISIGLGFDALEIGPPSVIGTPTTAANPCGTTSEDGGSEDAGPADGGTVVDSGTGSTDAAGE